MFSFDFWGVFPQVAGQCLSPIEQVYGKSCLYIGLLFPHASGLYTSIVGTEEKGRAFLGGEKEGAYKAISAAYAVKDVANEKKWKADPKMQMVKIPEAEMAEFRKIAGKLVWDAWVKEYADKFNSQELLDIVLNVAK